jgi:DNA-binding MarR family transcriptional regulator
MLCDLLKPGEQRLISLTYRPLHKLADLGLVEMRRDEHREHAVRVNLTVTGEYVREKLAQVATPGP